MTRTILPFHHTPPLPQTSGQRSSYPELDWEEEQVKEFLCIFVKDRSTRNGEHRVCGTTARKLYQGDIEDLKIYVGDDETIAKCLYRELQLYSKYAVVCDISSEISVCLPCLPIQFPRRGFCVFAYVYILSIDVFLYHPDKAYMALHGSGDGNFPNNHTIQQRYQVKAPGTRHLDCLCGCVRGCDRGLLRKKLYCQTSSRISGV